MHYNEDMALDEYVTTAEACELLGDLAANGERLDRSTLSRWVQLGKIEPAERLTGGRHGIFLFRRADVERLRDELAEARSA